ncbi:hypothetical protein ACQY0O_008035 [Thecaphora frezii]
MSSQAPSSSSSSTAAALPDSSPNAGVDRRATPYSTSPSALAGPSIEPSPKARQPRPGAAQERPTKRTRVRQACNRCKARKIKCGDLRPCENCTSLGLVCRDWRPGEDPAAALSAAAGAAIATGGYHSGSEHDGTADATHHHAADLRHRSVASADGQLAFGTNAVSEPRSGVHFAPSQASRRDLRSDGSEPPIPWPNTPYERSTHTVAWPPRPDPRRHRYLAYPYDSLYRNEFGHLKALSLSSGLGTLSYLHEYHKLANEQFLDALWQVLEGDAHDTGNTQMFALESEPFSPHALASLGSGHGLGNGGVHPPLDASGHALMDYDWSQGGPSSINVPFTYDSMAMAGNAALQGLTTRAPSSASVRLTVSPVAKQDARSATASPVAQAPASASAPPAVPAIESAAEDSKQAQYETANPDLEALADPDQPTRPIDPEVRPQDMWAYMDSKIPPQHRRSLIHTFLSTSYVLWPTFILSEFLATLKDAEQRKNPTFVCLVIAGCAIAAREEAGSFKGGPAAKWGHSFGFFELYLDIRRYAPRHTDWASLSHIQALFYLAHYCFGASGPYGNTRGHYLMNGCVSKCFDIGLHRSAETYTEAFTRSEIEARRRTLWAVYAGDKVSAAYGRPVMLRLSDIDVAEIDVDSDEYNERLPSGSFDHSPSLRAFHRAAIRLFCVLERVIDKINLPACSSSAALERLMRKKPKRPRQSANHDDSCMADHEPIGFSEELELLDMFQMADTPAPTTEHQDDPMYDRHIERLRTLAAFIRIFIYRHLFCMANTNLSREPPRLDYRDEMVKWCRDLLMSQRKMIRRGEYTDFGSVISYQLSQTGRGLIPAIYISSRLIDPTQDPQGATIIKESKELLVLAYDLLRALSPRLSASHRQLQIMQQAFKRLDLSLKRHVDSAVPARRLARSEEGEDAQTRVSGKATETSGLDLIAGVAGAEDGEGFEAEVQEEEVDADREKKPGWISDLPIDQPVEKGAPHTVNAYIGWPNPPNSHSTTARIDP